jgi:hypothetical protein
MCCPKAHTKLRKLFCCRCGKVAARETSMKLYPTHWTFVDIMTINTFIVCFVGKDNLAPRQSSSSVGGLAGIHQGEGPQGMWMLPEITSHRRSSRMTRVEVLRGLRDHKSPKVLPNDATQQWTHVSLQLTGH